MSTLQCIVSYYFLSKIHPSERCLIDLISWLIEINIACFTSILVMCVCVLLLRMCMADQIEGRFCSEPIQWYVYEDINYFNEMFLILGIIVSFNTKDCEGVVSTREHGSNWMPGYIHFSLGFCMLPMWFHKVHANT